MRASFSTGNWSVSKTRVCLGAPPVREKPPSIQSRARVATIRSRVALSLITMKKLMRRFAHSLWTNWIRPLAFAGAIIFPFKSAVADWNWVPSGSMRPTILEGELVLINKLAYDLKVPFTTHHLAAWGDPQRGDIVVCFSPADGRRLVKRVIGLPGDRIAVVGPHLLVNGQAITYAPAADLWSRHLTSVEHQQTTVTDEVLGDVRHAVIVTNANALSPGLVREYIVPAGQYFMMGDNRDRSFDSRYFGSVTRKQIVGQAIGVVLSFDPDRSFLPRPDRCLNRLR
jgi:signal peptidase I